MANILDPMDLKQILTLHIDGLSNRRIAVILGISRNTVNTYIKLFFASDYPFTFLLELDNAALAELFSFYTTIDTDRHNELMLFFEGGKSKKQYCSENDLNYRFLGALVCPIYKSITSD